MESVKKVLKGVIDLGEEVDRSLEDGWQWKDTLNFLDEVLGAPAVVKEVPAAIEKIKEGFTPEEKVELIDYVHSELDISNDEAEAKIEAAFVWISHTEDFLRAMKKKPAA